MKKEAVKEKKEDAKIQLDPTNPKEILPHIEQLRDFVSSSGRTHALILAVSFFLFNL